MKEMTTPIIEIFLLCYNRIAVIKAISSILAQNSSDFKLVVSNNSTDPAIHQKIKDFFPQVEVRNRGGIGAREHFQLCISEARFDYYCLFHDDDEMLPDFISEVHKAIRECPNAQAFGTNAKVCVTGSHKDALSFIFKGKYRIIKSKLDLVKQYFGRNNKGIAPFPSYVYKANPVESELMNQIRSNDFGKYSDVLMVMSQLDGGAIVWINQALMVYHLHENNDGQLESLRDRLRLLAVLKREFKDEQQIIDQYRLLMYSNTAHSRGGKYATFEKKLRCKRRFYYYFR
jgi:glycosyltransferase involved in cell wall biosynthesis